MKVFFDTNVYIAEALLGEASEQMITATIAASWRLFISEYVLDEIQLITFERLGFSKRLATLTAARCRRRASRVVQPTIGHEVPDDPDDSPILQAAIHASVDYLVTNDAHLLTLNPYNGVKIVSMADYFRLLSDHGLLAT